MNIKEHRTLYTLSSYQIADINRGIHPFEVYRNDPKQHPKHKHIVDIYVPIEPFNYRLKGRDNENC